jgi:hypothetical protein
MPNIAVHRLHSQQLEHTRLEKPIEVVTWLGAVQAQDYAGAKWSIGIRLPDSTDAGIEQAIADNTFFRTWAMRGTLHFVAASDIRWLLALVAPRIIARNARRYSELELDERTLARSNAVLADALQGGRQLNRSDLLGVLEQNSISTQGQRAAYMLQRASLDGLICQGVMRRNDPTYMSLDESLPETRAMEPRYRISCGGRGFRPRTQEPALRRSNRTLSGRLSRAGSTGALTLCRKIVHQQFICCLVSTSTFSAIGIAAPHWTRRTRKC